MIFSGHNLGTAPIEDAINEHNLVAESAIVGYPHEIKGNALYGFITLNTENFDENISNWVLSDFTLNEKDEWLDNTINHVSEMIISLIDNQNSFCDKNV